MNLMLHKNHHVQADHALLEEVKVQCRHRHFFLAHPYGIAPWVPYDWYSDGHVHHVVDFWGIFHLAQALQEDLTWLFYFGFV
jgi:hypothetical protein